MTDKEIKIIVAEQVVAMINNNIINGNGVEMFNGWLDDGDVFFHMGMSEEDIERAMAYAEKISGAIDTINNVLGEL